MTSIGKILVFAGVLIAVLGAALMMSDKLPFIGRLPGDLVVKRENFRLYIPLTTSILLSVALSLILWLLSFLHRK